VTVLDDLQDRVRRAADAQQPLCIIGGNSKRHVGREPQGEPIDVRAWSGIVDYQPTELVVTVRAGTTISYLQDALAQENQTLASEPPEFGGKATVGGTLACNLSGPSRPWHGSIRDHVLGVRIINGRAEHLRFGGQVMKNVAGFDVSRLQAGAMGTLGILTEVSLKVVPRPEATVTVRRSIDASDSLRVANELCRTPLPLSGACWYAGNLYMRLGGPASVVDTAAQRIDGTILSDDDGLWAGLREMDLPFFADAADLWCLSLRSTHDHFKDDADWLIDWRGARRWLAARCDRHALEDLVNDAGGEVVQFRGAADGADVFPTRSDAYRKALLRLKQAFDPAGIFNPGRLYAWL
jgi:glycolate oxidase FAD binding subunit